MNEQRNPVIMRFCLVLSLAIALIAIGLVKVFDYLSLSGITDGRISLAPGGGLLFVMIGMSLLALPFRRARTATVLASLTSIVALCQFALPRIFAGESPDIVAISLPLLVVVLLTELTLLAAIHLRKPRLVGLITGPIVVALGLLSLFSCWYTPLQGFGLGTIPDSTIIVSPLTILVGLVLPFFHAVLRRDIPDFSPAPILVGVFGIALTTVIWHAMRVQNSNNPVFELPPLVLFTGLILSFLMMLSHLFWQESERRFRSLRKLNSVVTAHLAREQSLRDTNERIMEFSRDILCSIDANGLFTSINPAMEAMLGYRPDELIGEPYDTLIPDADRNSTAVEIRKLMTGERRVSIGFRNHLRHRDGHIVTLSWTAEWSEEDQALFCVGREMTDQLLAETLMREREQFFSLSPDMFCIVDLNSHFFELNDAFVDVLGYERKELLGAPYMQLIHDNDWPKVEEAVAALITGQTIRDFQVRVINKNNSERWLELSATLSSNDLIYVAARDTTEIRHTLEKLRESETLLQIAEKVAHIGGWVVDVDTGQTRWSHAMFDIFELPIGEVPFLDGGLKFCTPNCRKTLTHAVNMCMQTGIPFDEEVQIRTRLGRLRWVRAIGQAVRNEDGRILQIQGGLQDITASHDAMEQIRRFAESQAIIFESITDAFFTLDREWRFTYVNQRSVELLSESRDAFLGNTLWEMFPATQDSEFERQYRHAMETGESVSFEAYYAPLDNWFEVSAYPSNEGLAVYYRSINERKQAQEKLAQTMAELERSNRDLQDFAFVASHDLQEPLRKIQAFSDRLLIRSDQFDEQERDYLQRMQSAAKRMKFLIRDLLTYSRVTTQARPMLTCDTNQILAAVLQDMETDISREKALVDARPLPDILGDGTQIRQVLQNLLSNAIKFHTPGQNPEVFIYAESIGEQGWTLVVSDKGVGFDNRYAEKLFHPFQRLHTQTFPGTGIGLAIVKKILVRHGASVTVESEVERGTTFRIHFPASRQTKENSND